MKRTLPAIALCTCISGPVLGDEAVPIVRCEVDKSVKSLTEAEAQAIDKGNRTFSPLVTEVIEKYGPPEEPPPPLPDTSNAKVIDWEQAKRMIWNGVVNTLMQNHSRSVVLITASGRAYRTTEPVLDDIFLVARLVDPCQKYITYILE
jgi:hypothetical protein